MKFVYTIIPNVRKSSINPGDTIEIEVYFSGYGKIEKNKFFVSHSHPNLILKENPGELEYCIKAAIDPKTNEIVQPVAGKKYLESWKLDAVGTYVVLNKGYFEVKPNKESIEEGFPQIMPEGSYDKLPPVLIKLNTAKDGHQGDYNITLGLTYGDDQDVCQDRRDVKIHVNSRVERHKTPIGIIGVMGVIIGLLAFVNNMLSP